MKRMELVAPAKVNLILRVFRRRRRGWHHVHSFIQAVSWGDQVILTRRARLGIELKGHFPPGLPPVRNLAYRAAQMVMAQEKISEGLTIQVRKVVPDGAGLGGGSSDAAAVIRGMQQLWGLDPSPRRWVEGALGLGSDVPFFLWGGCAEVQGIGEVVNPLSGGLTRPVWLIMFPERLSTRWAYQTLDRLPRSDGGVAGRLAAARWSEYWRSAREAPPPSTYNDFAPLVRSRVKRVDAVWRWLEAEGAGTVGMTGKGPTLFVLLHTPDSYLSWARRLISRFPFCRSRLVWPSPSPARAS